MPKANQEMSAAHSLLIQAGENKHYIATFHQDEHWIKLDAVLFKSGTNTFLDISRVADNGTEKTAAVGPSELDMLHLATRDKTHSAIRVRFDGDAVVFDFGFGNPVVAAIRNERDLKFKTEEGELILTDSTEKIRGFLGKVGGGNSIFRKSMSFIRTTENRRTNN